MKQSALINTSIALAAIIGSTMAIPSIAKAPALNMFNRLDSGLWDIHYLDDRGQIVRTDEVCLSDSKKLIQIQHRNNQCSHTTILDEQDKVTIYYRCGQAGTGQTTVKFVTAKTVHINSQGIAHNDPFSFAAEGKYVGGCR